MQFAITNFRGDELGEVEQDIGLRLFDIMAHKLDHSAAARS